MHQDILSIGDKIHISQLDRSGRPFHGLQPYVSQLVDFIDNNIIHIAAPIVNNQIILLEPKRNYNLCFYTNKGLYQCICEVIESYKENNVVITRVSISSDLEKLQRRQYYRLEIVLDMEYQVITEEEELLKQRLLNRKSINSEEATRYQNRLKELEREWLKASITDISGGGTRFNSTHIHNPGDQIRIRLILPISDGIKNLLTEARIVAVNKLFNRSGVYEYRVEFKGIKKKDREDLIKYIFEQERRRRKNEIG
ncbi:MAG: hypothetical protein GX306_00335 [Clostridiales bacterium]|nr:hypothetical protein [Clostridiales bacterium]